jgi:tRNA(Leu) C34 or U34 (ribose-2'-O)-methylase TrmL
MGKPKNILSLIALDTQGEWNLPILQNAADLSDATLTYAASGSCGSLVAPDAVAFGAAVRGCDTILACETGVKARSIFEMPAPRGRTALVVGNEDHGIPRRIVKQCTLAVTIPMYCERLSSINVAASSAVALCVLSRDIARKGCPSGDGKAPRVDLFVLAPKNPAECGSLQRIALSGRHHPRPLCRRSDGPAG